jgi:carbon storage regulator CsrA
MLVVTRKHGETIRIGEDIVVKVVQLGRGSVKIGIEAPAHVRVLRGELHAFPRAVSPETSTPHDVDEATDAEVDSDEELSGSWTLELLPLADGSYHVANALYVSPN